MIQDIKTTVNRCYRYALTFIIILRSIRMQLMDNIYQVKRTLECVLMIRLEEEKKGAVPCTC